MLDALTRFLTRTLALDLEGAVPLTTMGGNMAFAALAATAALATVPARVRERVATLVPQRDQMRAAVALWEREGLPVRLWAVPDGACYGLLVVEDLRVGDPPDSDRLMEKLVLADGVATVSGRALGLDSPGAAVPRLSCGMLAGPLLAEALQRLGAGLRRRSRG